MLVLAKKICKNVKKKLYLCSEFVLNAKSTHPQFVLNAKSTNEDKMLY